MDKDQFRNWLDFSDRMAREARPGMSGHAKAKLKRVVAGTMREAVSRHGLESFVDWEAHPYPGDVFESLLERDGLLSFDANGEPKGELGILALCCVKAGFDLAVAPSSGVVGSDFTAGMVRRMYPTGLPDFVARHFEQVGTDIATAPAEARVWL